MIRSCRDKDARRLLERRFSRRLQAIEKSGRIRLEVLDAATSLGDLDLPGFRLEALKQGAAMAIQKSKRLPPLRPGEVLKELLADAGLTVNALALALRVPANRIGGIVKGQRGITGDTSLRLARYFGTSAQMWMTLQAKYDLAVAEDAAAARIKKEVRPRAAA